MPHAAFEPTREIRVAPHSEAAPPGGHVAQPAPAPPHGLLSRLGAVGIAAIAASVLMVFGVGAATVSIVWDDEASATAPAEDGPTPVDGPSDWQPPVESSTNATSNLVVKASGSVRATGNAGVESAVVTLVNKERTKVGCRQAVRMNDRLRKAARAHSTDMATHDFFSHTGSDDSTFTVRADRAGYDGVMSENIAHGQRTAEAVMKSWMASSAHKRNILDCDARAIGVGFAMTSKNETYWTQDFGRE